MPANRPDRRFLDAAASVSMLAASITLVALAIRAAWPPPPTPTGYRPGDQFVERLTDPIPKVGNTLIVYLRSTCPYCTASMTFYRSLMTAEGRKAKVVVVGTESVGILRAYGKAHSFEPDDVRTLVADPSKLLATPTLLLVGPDEQVRAVWTGQLAADQEQEVRASVK